MTRLFPSSRSSTRGTIYILAGRVGRRSEGTRRSCGCTWTETEQRARGPRTRMPGAPSRDCALRPFTNHGARTPSSPSIPPLLTGHPPSLSLPLRDRRPTLPPSLLDNFTFSRGFHRERRYSKGGRGAPPRRVHPRGAGNDFSPPVREEEGDKRISTGCSLPFIILLKLLETLTGARFVIVDGHFGGLMMRRDTRG